MAAPLAKVVETNPDGSCAEASIQVPQTWIDERATVEVALPKRLRCHGCGGGGCDDCNRSGVFRLDENPERRTFELPLPPKACSLRLSDPVDAGRPELIVVHLTAGAPTNGVRRVSPPRGGSPVRTAIIAAVAIAAGLALAMGFLLR